MATSTKTEKVEKVSTLHPCGCGCGTMVKGSYAPGHDARHVSQIKKAYAEGHITKAKALAVFKDRPKLQAKLARSIELLEQERAKAAAEAKAAAAKSQPAKAKPAPRARASKKAAPAPPADSPAPETAPPASNDDQAA